MATLPPEIIAEILSRLPAKPLFRFKCVSKPWKSLITSPKFIKQHLKQTLISNPISNLIISHTSLVSAPITTNNDRKLHFSELHHPLKHLPSRPAVELIESCHGLLLLSDYPKKSIFLYNPTTKTHRLLPPAPSRAPTTTSARTDVYGFGYDSVSDDYKVVRVLEWFTDTGFSRQASVYSMRNDTWSNVKDTTSPYFVQRTNAVLAKEMLHFVVVKRDFTPVLKCFDLRTVAFSLVDYPKMDEGFDIRKVTMSMRQLRGCFCLVVNHQENVVDPRVYMGDPLYNRRFLCADVWEMKERGKSESWVKLFKVRKQEIVERCMHIRLVTYAKDNRSVLVEFDGGWFGWYDLVKKKVKRVSLKGLRVEDSPYLAWTSMDTLVSVTKDEPAVSKRGTDELTKNGKESTKKGTESSKKGTESTKKGTKKNDFLSSGFKLSL